jgi:hypothetical protein
MVPAVVSFGDLNRLTDGRLGTFDVACPLCGPERRSPANRRRAVLRIWRVDGAFAGYHCARCGEKGHVRDGHAATPDPVKLAKARVEAAGHKRVSDAERLRVARWLWLQRMPIMEGTPPWRYLRERRGYAGPIPATLSYLPARGDHPPAMIAAFGIAHEIEPGVLAAPVNIRGVHLTKLTARGDKISELDEVNGEKVEAKIMVGPSMGYPIALAPPNDLLGLVVTEGIEDGLSVYQATRLGVWAAGAANRMSALVTLMPNYVEVCTAYAHNDDAGRRGSLALALALEKRSIETRVEGFAP